MLFLELQPVSDNVRCITEKLSVNALSLAVEKSDLVIFDDEYYGGKREFLRKCEIPCVVITRNGADEISDFANVTAVFGRPFDVEMLVDHVREQGGKSDGYVVKKTTDNVINMELD
jgi:hypothetical protein